MVDHVWTREHFGLTVLKVWPRSFAWLCTLWQSCREVYKEQTLFKSQVMKMRGTYSKRAHKSDWGLFPALRKYSESRINSRKLPCSCNFIFQFHMVAQLGSLIWVVVLFMMETMDQVSLKMELSWTFYKSFQNSKKLFYHFLTLTCWHAAFSRFC
jgi:hypothetical protein